MIPHDKVEHTRHENDAYWTPPLAVRQLMRFTSFEGPILEPACGTGNISLTLQNEYHLKVYSYDKYDYGFGKTGVDFLLKYRYPKFNSLITNPPYDLHMEFLQQAAQITPTKFAFLMRLQYLEGKARSEFYEQFHLDVLVVGRTPIEVEHGQVRRMIPYAWYIFDLNNSEKRIQVHYAYWNLPPL